MKKGFASLVLVSLLVLGACGKGEGSAKSADETKLEIFNIKVETKDQFEDLVKRYESEHEGVKINVTTVGGGTDSKAALQAKFSAGDEPNIFFSNGLSDTEKWLDKLADLSDLEIVSSAAEGTLTGATIDGKVYGVPNNVEGTGLIINTEIFEKAGIDYKKIDSYEAFEAAIKLIDSKKADLGIDAAIAFSGKEAAIIGQFGTHFFAPEFDNSTSVAYQAKDVKFTYGQDLKKYVDLFNAYGVQPIVSLDYSGMVEDYFANGRVAVIESGNWIVPTLDAIEPELRNHINILPYFVKDQKPSVTASNGWYWTVNGTKTEKEVKASKDFLNWMYSDEKAKETLVKDFNYIPAYTSFDDNIVATMDNVSVGMYSYLKRGDATVWVDSAYPDGWAMNQFGPNLQSYLDKKITWEEFEKNSAKSWQEMR